MVELEKLAVDPSDLPEAVRTDIDSLHKFALHMNEKGLSRAPENT